MIRTRLALAHLANTLLLAAVKRLPVQLLPAGTGHTVERLRPRLAQRLRFAADRIDPDSSFAATGFAFTFEPGLGIVFREATDGGCRVWYHRPDYVRAHADAGGVLPSRAWLPGGRPTL